MGSGKTMLVSEMAQAVLKEDAPVCIEAFDGSTFGPEDADLQVRVTSPKAIYQLASNLNEIGLARAKASGTAEFLLLLNEYDVVYNAINPISGVLGVDTDGHVTALKSSGESGGIGESLKEYTNAVS